MINSNNNNNDSFYFSGVKLPKTLLKPAPPVGLWYSAVFEPFHSPPHGSHNLLVFALKKERSSCERTWLVYCKPPGTCEPPHAAFFVLTVPVDGSPG